LLRELRTHEQHVLSVRDLIVRELRINASVLDVSERGDAYVYEVARKLQTDRWAQHATEWSALRRKHAALWGEIADAYEALVQTKVASSDPPSCAHLRDLADRLEKAEI
jgi:hypothetical protein